MSFKRLYKSKRIRIPLLDCSIFARTEDIMCCTSETHRCHSVLMCTERLVAVPKIKSPNLHILIRRPVFLTHKYELLQNQLLACGVVFTVPHPVARRVLSFDIAMHTTGSLCPYSDKNGFNVSTYTTLTVLSRRAMQSNC
eukprot:m.116594 g.116594  ORF g.116594 m.116594 type:complete len:140 (+) comp12857_c0_seq2:848-1267(+)